MQIETSYKGGTTNTESCMYNYDSMAPVATITGYNNLPPNDQDAIMQHIAEVIRCNFRFLKYAHT